jgi:hypothetical protein
MRITHFAVHAGAQFFHMRLPARLDNLFVRGGTRWRRRSDDCDGGAGDEADNPWAVESSPPPERGRSAAIGRRVGVTTAKLVIQPDLPDALSRVDPPFSGEGKVRCVTVPAKWYVSPQQQFR